MRLPPDVEATERPEQGCELLVAEQVKVGLLSDPVVSQLSSEVRPCDAVEACVHQPWPVTAGLVGPEPLDPVALDQVVELVVLHRDEGRIQAAVDIRVELKAHDILRVCENKVVSHGGHDPLHSDSVHFKPLRYLVSQLIHPEL